MYRDDIETILRKTSFLSLLPEKDLEVVIDGFSERRFTLGNTICKAGESSDSFYVIYSGKARLVGLNSEGRETTMATLVKGDHFGEQTVLTGEASEFTVRASGELVALELPRARFLEILQKHPALKEYFEDYISDISLRNFIRQCSVFSPLDAVELRGFLECFRKASFQAGDFIVHEGDEGNAFYLIRSGDVEVIKESQGGKIVNRLGKGQFFGELALLTGAPRAAGVKAVTDVNTYCLDKKDFEKIIQTIPQIKNAILGVAATSDKCFPARRRNRSPNWKQSHRQLPTHGISRRNYVPNLKSSMKKLQRQQKKRRPKAPSSPGKRGSIPFSCSRAKWTAARHVFR